MKTQIVKLILVCALLIFHSGLELQSQFGTYTREFNETLISTGDSVEVLIGNGNTSGVVFIKTDSGFLVNPVVLNSTVLVLKTYDWSTPKTIKILNHGDSILSSKTMLTSQSVSVGPSFSQYFGNEPVYVGFSANGFDSITGLNMQYIGYVKICATNRLDRLRIKEMGFKSSWNYISTGEEEKSGNACDYVLAAFNSEKIKQPITVLYSDGNLIWSKSHPEMIETLVISDLLGREINAKSNLSGKHAFPISMNSGVWLVELRNKNGLALHRQKIHIP